MDQHQKELLLHALHKLKKSQAWPQQFAGVSRGEFFMLHKIVCLLKNSDDEKPGTKITDISVATEMSKPAVSQMLNSLEDKGMIERIMTKSDRRVVYVRLTEKGRSKMLETTRQMDDLMDEVVEMLGDEDTKELARLFDKLYVILEEIRNRSK